MSFLDKLIMAERSRDQWMRRAKDRLLALHEVESRNEKLERANAELAIQAQMWQAKCEALARGMKWN